MSVPVERGTTWTAGTPTKLIDAQNSRRRTTIARTYDVSPDGKRFLMIKQGGSPSRRRRRPASSSSRTGSRS